MDRHIQMSYLMDIYSMLLTEKQKKVMEYYYSDDLQISEIAKLLDISRQGVHDALRRTEKILEDYDKRLGLFDKYMRNVSLLDRIKDIAKNDEISELAEEIKNNL